MKKHYRSLIWFCSILLIAFVFPAHAGESSLFKNSGLLTSIFFFLICCYAIIVDIALIFKIFRSREFVWISRVFSLSLVVGLVLFWDEPKFFSYYDPFQSPSILWWFVFWSVGFLILFVILAPVAQYESLQQKNSSPKYILWIIAFQISLPFLFLGLEETENYYWKKEFSLGKKQGLQVGRGGVQKMLDLAAQKRNRLWGTGIYFPGSDNRNPRSFPLKNSQGYAYGVMEGIDDSALVRRGEALLPIDREAFERLQALSKKNSYSGVKITTQIKIKLLWDKLEAGNVDEKIKENIPNMEVGDNEALLVFVEYIKKYGHEKFCPAGHLLEEDRAALNKFLNLKNYMYLKEEEKQRVSDVDLDKMCNPTA